jgi:hypothetical protein
MTSTGLAVSIGAMATEFTHVLVSEGHLWGRKEVAIPVSAVTSLDDGIWLNLTKKQVEDLPPRN